MNSHSIGRSLRLSEAPDYQRHQWIWWIFSLYYFIPAIYTPFSWVKHSLILVIYLGFLGLCYRITIASHARVWQPIVGLIVFTACASFVTSGASSFFPYIGFFIGFCFGTRLFCAWLSVLVLLVIALTLVNDYPAPYFLFPGISGLITIGMVGVIERVRYLSKMREKQSHQEIRQLAMIAERERIARDLHDILGHTLSTVVLKAELADKLLQQQNVTAARQHLQELHQIGRESLGLVRQTVSGYKHRGLSGEVFQLCEKLRAKGFTVEVTGEIPQLSPQVETAVILALTELTTNILRHSNGNHCHLHFDHTDEQLNISVKDNGVTNEITPGNGLSGIKERLQDIAGELHSDVTQGCRFIISLPTPESVL